MVFSKTTGQTPQPAQLAGEEAGAKRSCAKPGPEVEKQLLRQEGIDFFAGKQSSGQRPEMHDLPWKTLIVAISGLMILGNMNILCHTFLTKEIIVEITVTDENFNDEVIDSELPVLVDFWAPWCMPCRMIAPIVEEISKEYEGQLKVCKMNVDDSPGISSEYRIGSIPTLSIFKKGEMVDQIVGAIPKDMLDSKIKEHI